MEWKQPLARFNNVELKVINNFKTFRRLKRGEHFSEAYKRVPYFIVFANKFDGRWKARLVANGSQTDLDMEDIYLGVLGMESV